MEKAVLVENAICVGSGSDLWKRINGLTKKILAKKAALEIVHGPLTILVWSHTEYLGQQYKRAIYRGTTFGWQHRQINDSDFDIVAII